MEPEKDFWNWNFLIKAPSKWITNPLISSRGYKPRAAELSSSKFAISRPYIQIFNLINGKGLQIL
jgi:hypothetical protein